MSVLNGVTDLVGICVTKCRYVEYVIDTDVFWSMFNTELALYFTGGINNIYTKALCLLNTKIMCVFLFWSDSTYISVMTLYINSTE